MRGSPDKRSLKNEYRVKMVTREIASPSSAPFARGRRGILDKASLVKFEVKKTR